MAFRVSRFGFVNLDVVENLNDEPRDSGFTLKLLALPFPHIPFAADIDFLMIISRRRHSLAERDLPRLVVADTESRANIFV